MTKMSFHKSKCEFWYTYRFTVCILEQCISIHYFRLTSHLLFTGAVFVPIITYYGGSTMFSRLCGTVYSVNNLEFRLWAPFNTGGEMQFDPMCYTLLHKVTKTYIFQKIICLLLHLYVKFWTNFTIHSYAFKCSSNRMKHLYHTCYQSYFTVPCLYSLLFYFILFIYFFLGGGVLNYAFLIVVFSYIPRIL